MTLWVLWATYGSFYLCRTNLSAALPGIEDEFGFSKTDMASVLISLKIAYGIGQLVNGQLAERISPRIMLATGMLASIALNLLFGAGASIWFFSFVWAMNGYSQALGWTPTMRVAANWMPVAIRGRSIGIIGTGYMVGASLSYVLSGWAVEQVHAQEADLAFVEEMYPKIVAYRKVLVECKEDPGCYVQRLESASRHPPSPPWIRCRPLTCWQS